MPDRRALLLGALAADCVVALHNNNLGGGGGAPFSRGSSHASPGGASPSASSLGPLTPSLSRFLLQRAVQTQCCYLTEFHDEAKAAWLAGFDDPAAPMGAEALSDKECRAVYHGLDAFCDDVTARTYLGAMLAAEPVEYAVRYLVGTPYGGSYGSSARSGQYDGFAETAAKGMEMWGEHPAAASRRRNPYLKQEKKYVEYQEILDPSKMASNVMSTREHLATEIAGDLVALANQALSGEPRPHLRDDGDETPLRRDSVELLDRLVTREAALLASGEIPYAAARWVHDKLEGSGAEGVAVGSSDASGGPVTAASSDGDLFADLRAAVCRLSARDALGDHSRKAGLASKWLDELEAESTFQTQTGHRVSPRSIAKKIHKHRVELYMAWAESLVPEVDVEHSDVVTIPSILGVPSVYDTAQDTAQPTTRAVATPPPPRAAPPRADVDAFKTSDSSSPAEDDRWGASSTPPPKRKRKPDSSPGKQDPSRRKRRRGPRGGPSPDSV